MAATLLLFFVADFTLHQAGHPLRELPAIQTPSGIRAFSHDARVGLLHAEASDLGHFHAWLVAHGLSAVAHSHRNLLPTVIARGERQLLARYGRVEPTQAEGVYRVHLGPGIVDPTAVAEQLRRVSDAAEPDEWWEFEPRAALNDPFYSPLWHLHESRDAAAVPVSHIHAEQAWDITMGNGAIIAVGDDGISMVHPDLTPNFFGVAHDFVDNDDDPSPHSGDGHGTRVTGVAAARGNNGIGGSGVCPECRALPMRLFTSNGLAYDEARLLGPASVVADAFRWAAAHGARIINSSWGPSFNPIAPVYHGMPGFVSDAIGELVSKDGGKTGVLFVWAAGNQQGLVVSYDGWAGDPRVFSVGALNAHAELATSCVMGPNVALLAPSADPFGKLPKIITTDLETGYSFVFNGTSAASPVVAGVAGLLLGQFPWLTLAQLMEVMLDSAERVDTAHANYSRGGESCTHGAGRVDAKAALDLAAARQAQYASGFTLHFELCGDGLDNDNNPATPDAAGACLRCIPKDTHEVAGNGIDDDCDGNIDNVVACVPPGKARCATCAATSECQADFVCADRSDGKRCLRDCSSNPTCAPGEQCTNGTCLPLRATLPVECSAFTTCTQSNGGIETCDGFDNDCNGLVDDLVDMAAEALAARGHCLEGAVGVCTERTALCQGGYWVCIPSDKYKPQDDTCDDLDNNCDGTIDDAAVNCTTAPVPVPPKPPPKTGCAATAPGQFWLVLLALLFI